MPWRGGSRGRGCNMIWYDIISYHTIHLSIHYQNKKNIYYDIICYYLDAKWTFSHRLDAKSSFLEPFRREVPIFKTTSTRSQFSAPPRRVMPIFCKSGSPKSCVWEKNLSNVARIWSRKIQIEVWVVGIYSFDKKNRSRWLSGARILLKTSCVVYLPVIFPYISHIYIYISYIYTNIYI
jgi:hypothetical protein